MNQPNWLDEAWREFGQSELPGIEDNPRIVSLYKDAGHGEIRHDETAWCAAFVGACLHRAGWIATGSLMARSYLDWGQRLDAVKAGAIAILSRGSDTSLGHVGFVVGESDDALLLLGGNQGDKVSVASVPRARLLGLRWPVTGIVQDAADLARAPDTFERALAHVLIMEGGFTDDPYDPGGPTNKGITLAEFAQWNHVTVDATSFSALKADLKAISSEVVSDIYRARYWQPASCSQLPPAIALMHFDAAVNHGAGTANRMLQEGLAVAVDGEIGPATLEAIANARLQSLLIDYAELRRTRYRALSHFWRFGRGWLARVDATLSAAQDLLPHDEKGNRDMTISATPAVMVSAAAPKWWGESTTIWGALLTAVAAGLPALASIAGISLTPDLIKDAGAHMGDVVQSVMALAGTLVTIYGRVTARQPLERRAISLKL